MYLAFGICGMISGLVMAAADILLDLKGKNSREFGRKKMLKSGWDHMSEKRFPASILLAMVGCPLQLLGFTAMAHLLAQANSAFGIAFWSVAVIGCSGSFFIHTMICLFPVVYQWMRPRYRTEEIDAMVNMLYDAVKLPFSVQYLCLVAVTGIMIIYALCAGLLPLSPWFSLLTAPVLTLIGMGLRAVRHDWFYDLPGIVMPSLGVGAVGLLAVLAMI